MSKKLLQESSWGIPIAVDWGDKKVTEQTTVKPNDLPKPRPVTETVVIGMNGNTIIADRVTKQNHI